MPKLVRLFQPGRIGKMGLRNRLIQAPTDAELADDEGYVTDELIDFYVARAKGGVGLVIVGASSIS